VASGRAYSPEVKAAALAAIVAGETVSAVARQFNIDRATVIRWRDASGVTRAPVPHEKQESLADAVYGLVVDNVAALRAVASTALDPNWRRAQPAGELATFAGVLSDKTFRILAAIEAGQTNLEPDAAPGLDRGLPDPGR